MTSDSRNVLQLNGAVNLTLSFHDLIISYLLTREQMQQIWLNLHFEPGMNTICVIGVKSEILPSIHQAVTRQTQNNIQGVQEK